MDTRILVVDDERKIADMIARLIGRKGYHTTAVYSHDEAIDLLSVSKFHVAIVDYVMPGEGGVLLAKYIKKHFPDMGIIIISSMPNIDLARDLIGVADRYVDKVQSLKPLLAAIKNVLKKRTGDSCRLNPRTENPTSNRSSRTNANARMVNDKIEAGPLSLDFAQQDFRFSQVALHLTPIELKALSHLAIHAGEPRSAAQLAQAISSDLGKKVEASRIRGVVHSLRRKLEPAPSNPRHLITVDNRGYRWDSSGDL